MLRVDRTYIHPNGTRPGTADMTQTAAVWAEAMHNTTYRSIGVFAGAMALGVTATSLVTAEVISGPLEAANKPSFSLSPTLDAQSVPLETRVNAIVAFLNRPAFPEDTDNLVVHVVKPGDSLASLAEHYYGDATLSHHIAAANRHDLTPSGHVKVGQSLQIPDI